jgi:CMP-N-acetylneuraminic acid synthetase
MKTICIIPARGGSKNLKNKNIKKLNNKPLIFYPINAAKKSGVCDHIFVTTDNSKIALHAKEFGAEVPFLRKKKYSYSMTTTEETLKHALLSYEKFYNIKFDICVFLTCTNFFRKTEWIKKAVNNLKKNSKLDSSFVVTKLYRHFWHELKNKRPEKIAKWMKNYTSRQIAPNMYREETGLACATRAKFWRKGKRIGNNVKFIISDHSYTGFDINDYDDYEIVKKIFAHLKKRKFEKLIN